MNWQLDAACGDAPPELFSREANYQRVIVTYCLRCPVRRQCLEQAMTYNEHGIWGATTREMRQDLAAQMGRRLLPLVERSPHRPHQFTAESRQALVEVGKQTKNLRRRAS